MKPLRCRCGQLISLDDLTYIAYHPHMMGANRVEIHFQCPSCGRLSERMLTQSAWDRLLLQYLEHEERSFDEWVRTEQLGPITDEEVRAMRRALRNNTFLKSLNEWERTHEDSE